MSETRTVTKPILDAMAQLGIFAMRLNSGTIRSGKHFIKLLPKGTADIVVFPALSPYVVWLETKVAGGHTNKEQIDAQAEFARKVSELGHKYYIVRSVDEVLELAKGWR